MAASVVGGGSGGNKAARSSGGGLSFREIQEQQARLDAAKQAKKRGNTTGRGSRVGYGLAGTRGGLGGGVRAGGGKSLLDIQQEQERMEALRAEQKKKAAGGGGGGGGSRKIASGGFGSPAGRPAGAVSIRAMLDMDDAIRGAGAAPAPAVDDEDEDDFWGAEVEATPVAPAPAAAAPVSSSVSEAEFPSLSSLAKKKKAAAPERTVGKRGGVGGWAKSGSGAPPRSSISSFVDDEPSKSTVNWFCNRMKNMTGERHEDLLYALWDVNAPAQLRDVLKDTIGGAANQFAKQFAKRRSKDRSASVSVRR